MIFPQQPQYPPQYPQYPPQQPQYPQYPQPRSQYPQQMPPQQPYPQPASPYDFHAWLKDAKRNFSRIGWGMCAMVVAWEGLAVIVSALLRSTVLQHASSMPNWAIYLCSSMPLYCVAMPLAWLLMRTVPALPTREFRLGPKRFFMLFVMILPLVYVANIVSVILAMLLSGGRANNNLADVVSQIDIWNVVFLVICAPIFEEWMFRKQLISRLRRYGEKTAILFSALAFALFHMNLYQALYAFMLGLMFGYVYTRTSRLRYSVAMHMLFNFNGGVIAPWVASRMDAKTLSMMSSNGAGAGAQVAGVVLIVMLYGLCMLGLIIAGVILLVREAKHLEFYTAPEELPRGTRVGTALGNSGMVAFIILTVALTALTLIVSMV